MYRIYFDTCILNDTYVLVRRELGQEFRPRDLKVPISKWAEEYVALYLILDLDLQWELEFGTSEIALLEISKIQSFQTLVQDKKTFLIDLFEQLSRECEAISSPIDESLYKKISGLFGSSVDASHLCRAIQGNWDIFLTTDFKTILDNEYAVEKTESRFSMKIRNPLTFIEKEFSLPLTTIVTTLYGNWTDPRRFINQFGQALANSISEESLIEKNE